MRHLPWLTRGMGITVGTDVGYGVGHALFQSSVGGRHGRLHGEISCECGRIANADDASDAAVISGLICGVDGLLNLAVHSLLGRVLFRRCRSDRAAYVCRGRRRVGDPINGHDDAPAVPLPRVSHRSLNLMQVGGDLRVRAFTIDASNLEYVRSFVYAVATSAAGSSNCRLKRERRRSIFGLFRETCAEAASELLTHIRHGLPHSFAANGRRATPFFLV
mmetsp:Transcript_25194/g.70219  ORF Transcript_25194/g.70219 Transcript_25194/m.70219 type:complete len:219 (+) Transcript_25194:206-862(+)